MNQRIKLLAEQAGLEWGPGGYADYSDFDHSLFAELIVRECAELTSRYQMGTTRLPDIIVSYNYSDKLEDVLKKHFGVKE